MKKLKIENWKNTSMIILFLGVLVINILTLETQSNKKYEYTSGVEYAEREEFKFTELFRTSEDKVNQYFKPEKNYLSQIAIRLAVNYEGLDLSDWNLKITLYDMYDYVIAQSIICVEEVENWRYYYFPINSEVNSEQEYRLEIQQITAYDYEPWPISVVCFIDPNELSENSYCMYNDQIIDGNIELVYSYVYSSLFSFVYIIIMDSFVLIVCVIYKRSYSSKIKKFFERSIIFLFPVINFLIVENITGNLYNIQPKYIVRNIVVMYIIGILGFLWMGQIKVVTILLSILFPLLGLVEYYVYAFRGKAISLFDIVNIKTAFTVANAYSFEIPIKIAICMICVLLYIFIQFNSGGMEIKKLLNKKRRYVGIVGSVIFIYFVINNGDIFFADLNMWDLNSNIMNKGLIYTLLSETKYCNIQPPENYSVKKIDAINDRISSEDDEENDMDTITPVNLIVIMNESFSDLEYLGEVKTDNEILPEIKSLEENTIKGYLHMPVFGAGTSDSEWEVLTGNTKQFLPSGSNAYQLYCKDDSSSLIQTLSDQGYQTIALHPYFGQNWNREVVYEKFGFDTFISMENWETDIETIRWCASDQTAYDKIISIFEEKDNNEKIFTFLVTMQNHGGYNQDTDLLNGFAKTVHLKFEETYSDAELYLSLINESDKAYKNLITYFSEIEDPTMIVMFGDHLPSLGEAFYNELIGKEETERSLVEKQELYTTPYIIWTNYELAKCEAQEEMSANYFGSYILELAGLKGTKYNSFLNDMREELPIIGIGAVCDSNGKWYEMDNLPTIYDDKIKEYEILEYNNLFDSQNRNENIFSILEN